MPPKNMTSWARNTHMPRLAAFFCCSSVAKWCRSAGFSCAGSSTTARLVCNGDLRLLRNLAHLVVVIGFPGHDRLLVEVEGRGRRVGLPLQAGGVPWVRWGRLAVAHGPHEVDHGQQVAYGENGRARGRKHVQDLEFGRIRVIAPRHSHVAQDELGEERQVESDEDDERGEFTPALGIHAAGNFGPPEMHPAEVCHHHASDHDVVEVGDDEISVMHVYVDAQGGKEQAGQSSDGKQADEAEGVEHRGLVSDGPLVDCGGPVKYLNSRGYGYEITQQ